MGVPVAVVRAEPALCASTEVGCESHAPGRRVGAGGARWLLLCLFLLAAMGASGHEAGLSSVTLGQAGDHVTLRYRFNAAELAAVAPERLPRPFETVSVGGRALHASQANSIADEADQVAWEAHYKVPADFDEMTLRVDLLEALPRGHRQLVFVGSGAEGTSLAPWAILDREHAQIVLAITPISQAGMDHSLAYWMLDGARHIWGGFDHLAFLGVLLLPLLMSLRRGSRRTTTLAVARLVTAFSIAHSMTLLSATFGWVALPDRLVESSIALSVVVAALANLWRASPLPGLAMAFGFGLLHGLGFAGALGETGLSGSTLILSLLAFNVGVELGQLAIVLVVLLVAVAPWARLGIPVEQSAWRRPAMCVGSVAIAALGAAWLVERITPLLGL
ncbi:MAG: HupE/UreJ family protein [Pseudomonadota bacterium]